MRELVKKLFSLLVREERRQIYLLTALFIFVGLLEVIGVASIMPFIAVAANSEIIQSNQYLNHLYTTMSFSTTDSFLFFLGVVALLVLAINNALSAITTWAVLRFANKLNHSLSKKLLAKYIQQPYSFHLGKNSSELSKNILSEAGRAVIGVFLPVIHVLTKAVVSSFIVLLLLIVDPLLALMVATVLGGAYGAIYYVMRNKLKDIGAKSTEKNLMRYQAVNEALGGIKDLKVQGKELYFVDKFSVPSEKFAAIQVQSQLYAQLPRYALETIAFGGILLIVLYLVGVKNDITHVMPLVALYAFAGYKLMPALQQIFTNISTMRFNLPALNILYDELIANHDRAASPSSDNNELANATLAFSKAIELCDISFGYQSTMPKVVENLNITINANTTVGFIGATGSGKTTVVDMILGLLAPCSGKLIVDGIGISPANIRSWQKNLGYIPQNIYLTDDSIANNIAFGVEVNDVDFVAVERAAKMANIHDFIVQDLPGGYQTFVGERGVRLSGGQRQRISIARALYHDPKVLILDEATSALDNATETAIMEAIHNLSHKVTIIMIAHRLTTLKECDVIYRLEGGRIVNEGTYSDLVRTDGNFKDINRA